MTTCIVISIKNVFVKTYTYLKQCMSFFSMEKKPRAVTVSNVLFISLTVRHTNIQSNFPVGHIMISPYCLNSNVNMPFEIKIG